MVQAEILASEVQGRNTLHSLRGRDLVVRVLTTYSTSLFEEMTDRLVELWDGMY
jgi:hypothetical protein